MACFLSFPLLLAHINVSYTHVAVTDANGRRFSSELQTPAVQVTHTYGNGPLNFEFELRSVHQITRMERECHILVLLEKLESASGEQR